MAVELIQQDRMNADVLEYAVESFRSAVEIARRNQDVSLPAFESNLQRVQKRLNES